MIAFGLEPAAEFRGGLDRFSIVGYCVLADGWANAADLALWYDGQPLPISVAAIKRPDLARTFGPDAEHWGFALCAALPEALVDTTKFRIRLNAGLDITDPANRFAQPADQPFQDMTERFKAAVRDRRGTLLEIGSRARSGTTYRDWFPPDQDYIGLDVSPGPNVDVVGDAHHLSRHVVRTVDYVFSIAVFEHILMPWKVALEMNKVMNDGGLALIISHAAWPLHEQPWDFLRYSKEAWSGVFNAHTGFSVVEAQYQFEASVVPRFARDANMQGMSLAPTYLLSGCLVRKSGAPQVEWAAEAADVYDLGYSHE